MQCPYSSDVHGISWLSRNILTARINTFTLLRCNSCTNGLYVITVQLTPSHFPHNCATTAWGWTLWSYCFPLWHMLAPYGTYAGWRSTCCDPAPGCSLHCIMGVMDEIIFQAHSQNLFFPLCSSVVKQHSSVLG